MFGLGGAHVRVGANTSSRIERCLANCGVGAGTAGTFATEVSDGGHVSSCLLMPRRAFTMSSSKQRFLWKSPEMEEVLIRKVRSKAFLYDTKLPEYRDQEKRVQAWEEIGSELQMKPLKNLGGKAEELIEKKKKEVEELAAEKKSAATSMIEAQIKKTGDSLWQAKSDAEKSATAAATDAKKAAVDAFDEEVKKTEASVDGTIQQSKSVNNEETPSTESVKSEASPLDAISSAVSGLDIGKLAAGGLDSEAEKVVDSALKQVNVTVDEKLKEADHYIDEKRDGVVHKAQEAISKATEDNSAVGSMLGKAKGLLNL